jgi:UDP-N-acetylmuramoyl-L-alanyl-D-glutamate--2,6-diaminopimelate ligase
MGDVVARLGDVAVVTSDNPRTEDPEAIVREILAGMHGESEPVVLVDRREAIGAALRMAQPGDVVVIAGKGHEDYQIIGDRRIHFDDREIVREILGEIDS